jgi:NAD(P)-dependent dehydrogenase (short-subunit alcohol dehydrogenase family)
MARGKLILITGVTRGLGRAMVDEFITRGHTVVGCARTGAETKKLRQRYGDPHDFYPVDVASDEAVKSWASLVLATHGVPQLLINNAGVINRNAPLWELEGREFDEVLDVNVKGTANVIRHFGAAMVKNKAGVIVNFSSGWGRSAEAEVAPYCASKWAIEGLTQSLAQELPNGMAAVALNPGIINTDMLRNVWAGAAANYPSPEEWAKLAVPLLLKLSALDNGKPLTVPVRGAND